MKQIRKDPVNVEGINYYKAYKNNLKTMLNWSKEQYFKKNY